MDFNKNIPILFLFLAYKPVFTYYKNICIKRFQFNRLQIISSLKQKKTIFLQVWTIQQNQEPAEISY